MNITLLNVTKATKVGPSGKPYEVLDLAYKNNTYQGKVEGRNLMPFGDNAPSFNVLKNAQAGQTFEITVVKNLKGFNDWTNAVPAEAGAQAAPGPAQGQGSYPGKDYQQAAKPVAKFGQVGEARANSFPTTEERAKTQVYIVRQSSLSNAVNSLVPGAKSPLKAADVIALAKEYEQFVFGIDDNPAQTEVIDADFGGEQDVPY